MLRNLTLGLLLASAAAVPAAAAPFSGFRVEGQIGWDNPVVDYDIYTANGVYVGNYHNSRSGFMYGGEVGYDLPLSDILRLGALFTFNGTTVDVQPQYGVNLYDFNAKIGTNWNLGARMGFLVAPATMLYGTLGYAQTAIRYYYTDNVVPANSWEEKRTYGGFLFAAGAEQAFGERFYGKLEYRYQNYQDGVSRNQIVGGVGIRF